MNSQFQNKKFEWINGGKNKKDRTIQIYNNNNNLIPIGSINKAQGKIIIVRYGNCDKNYFQELLAEDNNLCELVMLPCRMFFDYDKNLKLTKKEVDEWNWDECLTPIKQTLRRYFGNKMLNISGSIAQNKLSLHIVISLTMIKTRDDMDIFKNFVKDVLKKEDEGWDDSVYSKDRLMKSVNQSKGDGRIQKILNGDEIHRHMINLYQKDTKKYCDVGIFKLQELIDANETESVCEEEEETKGEVYNHNPFCDIPKTKEMKFYQGLSELISIDDLDNYNSWIKIVYALRSISYDCKELCHYISMKSSKYDSNSAQIINKAFDNFEQKDISEGTLHYYSKRGNEGEYYRLLNKEYNKLSIHTHDEHSEELHKIIGKEYRFYKDGSIYHFNGVYWETMKNLDDVEKDIRKKYSPHFKELYLAEKEKERKKELKTIVNNLGSKSYSLSIAQVYRQNHQVKAIEMETEPFLFVFENMVFDLRTGREVEASPDYNCIMNTGYPYKEPTDEEMIEMNTHFDMIFPNADVRECYKYLLASSLFGYKLEKFIVSNGCGGNGKSMLHDIHSKMLGEGDDGYSYTLQSSSLLQPLSTGANTEIAKIHNKRFTICSEPSNGGQLDNSTIKELTGEDKINARQIYSTNTEVIVKHTLFMMCNNKPALKETPTRGDSRRFVDVPFDALFVNKNELDEKLEEQKNGLNLHRTYHIGNNKFAHTDYKKKMRCALFNLLLPYAVKYHESDYNIDDFIPKIIENRSNEYIAEQDLIFEYVKEICVKTNDDQYIKVRDVFEKIKTNGRLREFGNNGKDLMIKEMFVKCSSSMGLGGSYHKLKRLHPRNILMGWKFRDELEEDEDELD